MGEIKYEAIDGVALVTLDAVSRRNALTPTMATELVSAFDEADADPDIGAIVLSGRSAFCAGADLAVLSSVGSDPSEPEAFAAMEALYSAFTRVGEALPPTIAAVRGAAVGAGFNLALATDLRVVARDARLISGFGRISVHPGGGHYVLLARLAGREVAAAAGLFGLELSGQRAFELGIAAECLDDSDVEARAFEVARRVAVDPELSRRMAASFRRETASPGVSWDVGVQIERAPQMWSLRRKAPAS